MDILILTHSHKPRSFFLSYYLKDALKEWEFDLASPRSFLHTVFDLLHAVEQSVEGAEFLQDVMNSILVVGLEPAFGFYHQHRTQAPPLALDLMEIFRVPLVNMIVVASINRHQWDVNADFEIRGSQVWLSDWRNYQRS